jgi:hypothetical protein
MGKERFLRMSANGYTENIIARRVLHIFSPIFLVYYFVPEDTWIGLAKEVLLLVILLAVLVSELVRIIFRPRIFGLKHFEQKQISAYVWASFGFAMAFLLFESVLVVPVIFGMAWIDPLCGWLRRKKRGYPLVPLVGYAVMMMFTLLLISDFSLPKVIMMGLASSPVAIASEYPNLRYMDDDFTMVFFPLLALALLNPIFP